MPTVIYVRRRTYVWVSLTIRKIFKSAKNSITNNKMLRRNHI